MKKLNELNYSKQGLLPAIGKELFCFFLSLMHVHTAVQQLVLQRQIVVQNAQPF